MDDLFSINPPVVIDEEAVLTVAEMLQVITNSMEVSFYETDEGS